LPFIFSNKFNILIRQDAETANTSTPLGIIPSEYHVDIEHFESALPTKKKYHVNEINLLGEGDIFLLYTDGLTEQNKGKLNFADARLEEVLKEAKHGTAREISDTIIRELNAFYPPEDDVSLAVIKKI